MGPHDAERYQYIQAIYINIYILKYIKCINKIVRTIASQREVELYIQGLKKNGRETKPL